MALKTFFLVVASAIGGIYLTSDEGKKAREALREKKSIFQPVIFDLIKQANEVLDGTEKLNSEEVRFNIEKIVNEAKKILLDIDLDKTTETIKEAIKVANKKIRDAANEHPKTTKVITQSKSMNAANKSNKNKPSLSVKKRKSSKG